MLLQAFSESQNWIYNIYKKNIKKCIANDLNISVVSSAVIFLTTIKYGNLHQVSTQASYLSGFFHISFVDGWLKQVMPLDLHDLSTRYGTFGIDDDNLK